MYESWCILSISGGKETETTGYRRMISAIQVIRVSIFCTRTIDTFRPK